VIASAPPPIVPVVIVATLALGTVLGFTLAREAIAIRRPSATSRAADRDARSALSSLDANREPSAATYGQIADALHRYLDARFSIASAKMSGADIERSMTRASVPRAASRMTAQLIERCAQMQDGSPSSNDASRVQADIETARTAIELIEQGDAPSQ
jgi:hypothetical protein